MVDVDLLANGHLPERAHLSPAEFGQRVANFEALRTRRVPVSVLVRSEEDVTRLETLHALVHSGRFEASMTAFDVADTSVPFLVHLPRALRQWLAAHSRPQVKALVGNWMGALYAAHARRDDVWPKLRRVVSKWASAHYSRFQAVRVTELTPIWADEYERGRAVAGDAAAGLARTMLINPLLDNERPFLDSEAMREGFRFPVRVGYFRKADWLFIVIRDRAQRLHLYRDNLGAGSSKANVSEKHRLC